MAPVISLTTLIARVSSFGGRKNRDVLVWSIPVNSLKETIGIINVVKVRDCPRQMSAQLKPEYADVKQYVCLHSPSLSHLQFPDYINHETYQHHRTSPSVRKSYKQGNKLLL